MPHRNKYASEAKKAQEANKRLKACERKKAYETEEAAYQQGQRVYRCPYCNKWHRTGSFVALVKKLEKRKSRSK